ncbi:MAG: hypothetical protein ACR2N4_17085 [Jatrophihabitans sp.]
MTGDPLTQGRVVADAVLYEGYLLYPYRASSSKNQVRWQFGVLGPPSAPPGIGEPPELSAECLLSAGPDTDSVTVYLRCLQLQNRRVHDPAGRPVAELRAGGTSWTSWEEAVPVEVTLGPLSRQQLRHGCLLPVEIAGGSEREPVLDGTVEVGELVRSRLPLRAELAVSLTCDGPVHRLRLTLRNVTDGPAADREAAIERSLLGSHLLVQAHQARFVSLLEPPPAAAEAAERCVNQRCWPVLASPADDVVLVSPIILYDHPEVAAESAGALFDSTEIDEILTLRVMTLTDAEKAEARATDPHAGAIIDRCDAMSAEDLQRLHGVLRDPRLPEPTGLAAEQDWQVPTWSDTGDQPWWDPGVDGAVSPETDQVLIGEIRVAKGSRVRVQPRRRADAQDLFFAGQEAKVTAVFADVDGNSHVAVVLTDDPAADLHEWYGRYLYFAPEELEPLPDRPDPAPVNQPRKEG